VRRIAVVLGGRSSEHEISLASAASVVAALRARGNEVTTIEIARGETWLGSGQKAIEASSRLPGSEVATTLGDVDVVFPVLHGPFGEDGTVQGLLELAGVLYVGAGVLASALCMDKDVFSRCCATTASRSRRTSRCASATRRATRSAIRAS
jgi:D-alanine-D-alanine ligase